jgi:hypothetical protein
MATVVFDVLGFLSNTLLRNNSTTLIFGIQTFQIVSNACCDFIAQCILIYRCWIVWGRDIRVLIIPSILAITCIATWLAERGALISYEKGEFLIAPWGITMILTSLAASMAVNTLVTGLIVYKILRLKMFMEYKPTLIERTLDSAGGIKLQYIVFIIIESGMMLFAIQLIRIVLTSLVDVAPVETELNLLGGLIIVMGIHQMLNGIAPTVILVRVSMKLSFHDEASFKELEASGSLHFNNPPSDSSTSLQESSEDIDIVAA